MDESTNQPTPSMDTVVNTPAPAPAQNNNSGWVVAVIILILLVAGGAYFWMRSGTPAPAAEQPQGGSANINVTLPAGDMGGDKGGDAPAPAPAQ